MALIDFDNRYGENEYSAQHKCGHSETIYYHGKQDLKRRLIQAENSLCSKCKDKKLKKENVHIFIPYRYYKEHLINARNIVKGKYDNSNNTIELWLPKNKADEYIAEVNRRYYEINNTPIQNNRSKLTIIIKGNTIPIKNQLKKLGAKWTGKNWLFNIEVVLNIDKMNNIRISPEVNPLYYNLVDNLDKLGCIPDYSKINW